MGIESILKCYLKIVFEPLFAVETAKQATCYKQIMLVRFTENIVKKQIVRIAVLYMRLCPGMAV